MSKTSKLAKKNEKRIKINFHSQVILFTLFAIICFDLSFIRIDNLLSLLSYYNEVKIELGFVFRELIGLLFIIFAAIICILLCNFRKFKYKKFAKMLVIGLIMLTAGIAKRIFLGASMFGVIRIIIYIIFIGEAVLMVYIDRFKTIENTIKRNINEINKIEKISDRISIIQYYDNECSFCLDKIVLGFILLGSGFSAAMSILWVSKLFSSDNYYLINIRSTVSICIGFSFIMLELFLWCFKPLWNNCGILRNMMAVNKLNKRIISKRT